jgi:glucokinase
MRGGPVVSVDLGGTNTRVAIVEAEGDIAHRSIEPTARMDEHPDELIGLIKHEADGSGAASAVIGVPGRVDHGRGTLEYAPNLPLHWATHISESELASALGMPVSLANDADLAAVGEYRFGAGRGTIDMVYLTMSTGVGCGVILGGKLLHGRRSLAEAGHGTLDAGAEKGMRTFEQSASGTALGRIAERYGIDARGMALVDLVRARDARALAAWDELVTATGFGVASLAHLFSPEVIVIGGGLGLTGDLLYEPWRKALVAYGPRDLPDPILIRRAELGDDAGLIGAAGWASTFDPQPYAPMKE